MTKVKDLTGKKFGRLTVIEQHGFNDAVRTGKTLKMFSELFVKKIDKQPTIQAIPIDVLDKISAEIKELATFDTVDALIDVNKIINKYKAESEKQA